MAYADGDPSVMKEAMASAGIWPFRTWVKMPAGDITFWMSQGASTGQVSWLQPTEQLYVASTVTAPLGPAAETGRTNESARTPALSNPTTRRIRAVLSGTPDGWVSPAGATLATARAVALISPVHDE